jgi:RNA polymerase sigma-70 factor (family 1)
VLNKNENSNAGGPARKNALELQAIQARLAVDDPSALRELYALFSDRLFQFAHALLRSREMAEEVVEDVFIQVWKKSQRISEIENLSFYLYTSTRNFCYNYHRKYHRNRSLNIDEVELPYYQIEATAEELMIVNELLQQFHAALNALPPKCRLIFKLVKEEGLKYKEVAELLSISQKTVEAQMGIAFRRISQNVPFRINPSRDNSRVR